MQNDDKLPLDAKVVTLWNLVSQDLNAISSQAHCLSIHTKQLQEAILEPQSAQIDESLAQAKLDPANSNPARLGGMK